MLYIKHAVILSCHVKKSGFILRVNLPEKCSRLQLIIDYLAVRFMSNVI